MSGEAKVLNGLLQRRALEQAFAELGRTTEPAAVQQQAQTIAEYGSAALQHLLTLLDTPDPQLRGGLGQVARYLPRQQVVPALRAVARDHERSDQARLAAVTLLERFLGESIDNALIGDLGNPDVAARQSLLELIAAMNEEPLSVVEYLEQLGEQPSEVAGMLLDALPAVERSPHLATFLRMLAQGEDAGIARRAVDELVKLRTPASVRALASLVPNLPPSLAPVAERGLRKLRFSGVQQWADYDPNQEPWYAPGLQWRALISTVDSSASQFIWFIGAGHTRAADSGAAGAPDRAVFFTVLTQDPYGLRDASGSLQAAADHAPPKRREGALHYIVGDGRMPGVTLLEAPFGMACAALKESLALNWASGEATPMGYRLFSPLVWLAEEAADDDEEIGALTPLPDSALAESELLVTLDHPAFYGWFADADGSLDTAHAASYARRFKMMSRWLALAGDDQVARLAGAIAYHFENETPVASTILAAAVSARASDDAAR
ncbi:MAG: hypothetical protein ACM30E_12935 [Nitrososphaerales archaeon]